jgi:hypothetical protein
MRRILRFISGITVLLALAACSRTPSGPSAKVFGVGEKVTTGHLTYAVLEVQWITQLATGPQIRVPQNRFLLIRLSTVNGCPDETLLPNLTVEDDAGNSYPELNNGDGVPQWTGFLRKVKPAEASQGVIAFDAPPRHYRLKVVDESGDQPRYIDLPLNFGS